MASKPLFNLADREYQFWKSFTYKGKEWTFDHLIARKHTFSHPKRNETYTLYFTISHHVFTVATDKVEDLKDGQIYPHKNTDLRAFCEERYRFSFYLPEILANLPEQFCYHGGYSRYCTCKISNDDGSTTYYQVVYRVWKERGKMRFHVESAYPLPERLGKIKRVSFWVICYNLRRNKTLPKPA